MAIFFNIERWCMINAPGTRTAGRRVKLDRRNAENASRLMMDNMESACDSCCVRAIQCSELKKLSSQHVQIAQAALSLCQNGDQPGQQLD